MSHSKAKREQKITKKQKINQICFEHEDFVSLARTVEDEKRDTTSTLRGALFSAALGSKATFSLASGASPGAHARFRGHATSRWRPPAVAFAEHSASHDASGASGASVVAPHVATVVSAAAGLALAHRSRLLLLHIQTHLPSKHDGLQRGKEDQHKRRQKILCAALVSVHSSGGLQNQIFLTQ